MKKIDDVPRIKRNQPDVLFVKRFDPDSDVKSSVYRMKQVPFDHKNHEKNQQTCRICHHEDFTSCNICHTMAGSEKGNFIKLEKAMHQPDVDMSCAGCHGKMARHSQCNGCHIFIGKDKEKSENYCTNCHLGMVPPDSETPKEIIKQQTAKALLEHRLKSSPVLDTGKIPETVTIKALENKYGPVKFPHRKIFQALVDNIKDNKLAEYFHDGTQKMCQGCHHNSPAAQTSPRCSSCHGKPFDESKLFVPGLMGAYHRQCMGCHKEMKMDKPISTDCTACHAEKKKT
jgi:hypothetical protein